MSKKTELGLTIIGRDSRTGDADEQDYQDISHFVSLVQTMDDASVHDSQGNLLTAAEIEAVLDAIYKDGQPTQAIVKETQEVESYDKGNTLRMLFVQDTSGTLIGEYPISEDQNFEPGQTVTITPRTKYNLSGGSLTVYNIEPAGK